MFPIESLAMFSDCGHYRYTLERRWDDGRHVAFLMFNPSTADSAYDDPTIRRCVGFAKRWGYGRLTVINLFALRSPNPRVIERSDDPVGSHNNLWTATVLSRSRELVCAWGCEQHMRSAKVRNRVSEVLAMADAQGDIDVTCLGYTKGGTPRHPLMLAYDTPRVPFVRREAC